MLLCETVHGYSMLILFALADRHPGSYVVVERIGLASKPISRNTGNRDVRHTGLASMSTTLD